MTKKRRERIRKISLGERDKEGKVKEMRGRERRKSKKNKRRVSDNRKKVRKQKRKEEDDESLSCSLDAVVGGVGVDCFAEINYDW